MAHVPLHYGAAARSGRRLPLVGLLAAKAISDIGFALDFVCFGIFVWLHSRSALLTGAVGLALYAGGICGGRLGHRYGGSWDRRRAMVTADLARMLALVLLVAVPAGVQLWVLFAVVLVIGTGRSVFEATFAAATPAFAGDRAQLVNGVASGLKGLAFVIGMGLAAVIVPFIGFRGVFAIDAATYALSALVLVVLPLPFRYRNVGRDPNRGERALGWRGVLAAGIAVLLVVRGLDALGSGSHHVGLPILGDLRNPDNPAGIAGMLWMVWALGTVVGSFGLRPLLARQLDRSPALLFYLGTATMSVGFIGIFWLAMLPAMLVSGLVAGLGDALSEISFKQALQRLPDERRGQAFGLAHVVINAGFVVGLGVAALVITPQHLAELVLLLHGIPIAAAIWAMTRWGRALGGGLKGSPDGNLKGGRCPT